MATITPAFILNGFGVAEPTPGDTIDPSWLPAAAGGAAWGGITGTLAAQTDLQGALDGKAATAHNHDASYSALAHTHAGVYQPVGSYAAAAHTHAWATDVTGKPTTLAGYGITDAPLAPITTLVVPTTGQTQTFTITKAWHIIACNHLANIAAQTFVFPVDANSTIGQELRIFSRFAISTVTLTLNSNTLIGLALTTLPANGNVAWRKVAANTWARIQ